MRSCILAFSLFAIAFSGALSADDLGKGVELKVLTVLDRQEPYDAHLFHSGYLWVGHSRDPQDHYRLEAYTPDGEHKLAARFPHSVSYIYPYGPGDVIVVGRTYQDAIGHRTHYSIVSVFRGALKIRKTYTFREEIQVDQFAGAPGKLYFGNPGDRQVIHFGFWGPKPFPFEIYGPGQMLLLGDSLYVVEHPDFGHGNIARIDLKTEKVTRIFPKNLGSLASLTWIPEIGRLAVSDYRSDALLFIDPKTHATLETVKVAGSPRGMTTLGHCLAVVSAETKQISFLDMRYAEMPLVDKWDLSPAGNAMTNPRDIAIDPATGNVFVRSIAPCVVCQHSGGGVVIAHQPGRETFKACRDQFRVH